MKKFAYKTLLFLLPIVLVVAVFEYSFIKTGDIVSIDEAIKKQKANQELVYLRRDFPSNPNYYKMEMIKMRKPKVLIIGSSRVMQFRKELFGSYSDEMYNAGGIIQSVNDIVELVNHIKEGTISKPELLIVGIDPWLIKTNYQNNESWLKHKKLKDEIFQASTHWDVLKTQILKRKLATSVTGNSGIGGNGRIGIGYRWDGSMNYGNEIIDEYEKNKKFVDREKPPVIERINSKTRQFETPAKVDCTRIQQLVEAFKVLKSLKIKTIVYQAPFSSESFNALEKEEDYKEWWSYYQRDFVSLLEDLDIEVLKTEEPKAFKLDDTYMIDGFHPTETFVAHQWLKVLNENKELGDKFASAKNSVSELLLNEKVMPVSLGL